MLNFALCTLLNLLPALYTKEQASAIKQAFWKAFGQYMALHTSADGLKINWINYKTGIRHLVFRMDADNKSAFIAIEINHPDADIRELMFLQFEALKHILEAHIGEEWRWEPAAEDQGRVVSRISKSLNGLNIFRQEDWPDLISFLKPRIIALDQFWSEAQYGFELFRYG
jgi:hypothetical protein